MKDRERNLASYLLSSEGDSKFNARVQAGVGRAGTR